MTTIKLPHQDDATGRLREIFDLINQDDARLPGSQRLSKLWLAMAHHPAYLEANWQRSRAIMHNGRLPALEKELLATAVSMLNGCTLCIDRQVTVLERLGLSEVALTELLGVVEDAHGLTRLVGALLVEPDLKREFPAETATLIGLPHGDELDPDAREVLADIRIVECALSGVDRVPNLWRVIASNPAYLRATWTKHKLVMAGGELSVRQKQIVALGVAMNGGCRYLIERLTRTLQRAHLPLAEILEVAAVVDHFNCLNTVAAGMQLHSDSEPPNAGADLTPPD